MEKKKFINEEKVFTVLKNIYISNRNYCVNNCKYLTEQACNVDLLNLVADKYILLFAYVLIKKDKNTYALGYKRTLISKKTLEISDIDLRAFKRISRNLKLGKSTFLFSKSSKKFSLNLKNFGDSFYFLDTVIEEALKMVLLAIYEPYFSVINGSFGFRPDKSIHDVVNYVNNLVINTDLFWAIKGVIRLPSETIKSKFFINVLYKKIKDKKFLTLIKKKVISRIPQKNSFGTFLYLWNVYLSDFDNFVTNLYVKIVNKSVKNISLNKKRFLKVQEKVYVNNFLLIYKLLYLFKIKYKSSFLSITKMRFFFKSNFFAWKIIDPIFSGFLKNTRRLYLQYCVEKEELLVISINQQQQKKYFQKLGNLYFFSMDKAKLIYLRYASDWIMLSNIKLGLLLYINKNMYSFFKREYSDMILCEKSFVTYLKVRPVSFLGFNIKAFKNLNFASVLFLRIDVLLLLNKLYVRGFCNKKGFPREISKMNNLNISLIIQSVNSVLFALILYYSSFVKKPTRDLSRWVYIIRYSCLKTIAQKYRITVRKVFRKFTSKSIRVHGVKTIHYLNLLNVKDDFIYRVYKLETLQSLLTKSKSEQSLIFFKRLRKNFWRLSKVFFLK